MIVLRRKQFSLLVDMSIKSNSNLREALFEDWKDIKVSEDVKAVLKKAGYPVDNDFAKLMQLVYQYAPGTGMSRINKMNWVSGNFFMTKYDDLVKYIFDPNYTPGRIMKYKEPRVIVGVLNITPAIPYFISYIPRTKTYIATMENLRSNPLVGKKSGINNIGIIEESKDFKTLLSSVCKK